MQPQKCNVYDLEEIKRKIYAKYQLRQQWLEGAQEVSREIQILNELLASVTARSEPYIERDEPLDFVCYDR
jgi:hypothetical protein